MTRNMPSWTVCWARTTSICRRPRQTIYWTRRGRSRFLSFPTAARPSPSRIWRSLSDGTGRSGGLWPFPTRTCRRSRPRRKTVPITSTSSSPAVGERLVRVPLDRLRPHPANANQMSAERLEALARNVARPGSTPGDRAPWRSCSVFWPSIRRPCWRIAAKRRAVRGGGAPSADVRRAAGRGRDRRSGRRGGGCGAGRKEPVRPGVGRHLPRIPGARR